ncbi:FCD domain-containing protein [Aquamicrobium sp. LC103]|uniref:GntR family transcriptional regulator n=1 Tax=Aquamicrobium sp. LC103 TaxID=1120658 RepID=UPI00063E81F8|nr:FCD domain-containing protein [Aquamicrobium sp. LC103]TKT82558.1 FCD domain-containing protein [Aquamicrobium sp. LC103]
MKTGPRNGTTAQGGDTLSERAAASVERDILAGVWLPGARLGIHALSAHYGIGATPLREGLSRLVSRGLIQAVGQRGFRVAPVSRDDLEDITRVRCIVEAEALRRSIATGDDEWEAGVLACLHRLRRMVERDPRSMREDAPEFDRLHKEFHRSILTACQSERLLRLQDELYDQAYRYRRAMMRRFENADWFIDEHQQLADIILARKADEAVAMLMKHLGHTLHVVYGDEGADRTI